MNSPFFRAHRFALVLSIFATAWLRADPWQELAAVSSFKDANPEKLAAGQVLAGRGPAMSFPRGLAIESCYVVRKPVAPTAEFLRHWDPAKSGAQKIFLHIPLSAHPTAAEFSALGAAPANGAVKGFAAATQKLGAGASELQLSKSDAAAFATATGEGSRGALPAKVAAFWTTQLQTRADAFLSGGLARLPPYENAGETIRAAEEAARLLKDAPKIRSHFSALLDATPLAGGRGTLPPIAYWEMFDVEGLAAVNLGANYAKASAGLVQAADFQYYASGGYYLLFTFFQMWPVQIGGQDCTLIWRTDLISASSLAALHGIERMGSSTAMMRETQKSISRFLKDAAK